MDGKKLNILIVSSRPLSFSGGYLLDCRDALVEAGHNVVWGYPGIEKQQADIVEYLRNRSVPKKMGKFKQHVCNVVWKIKNIADRFLFQKTCNLYFFIEDESAPKIYSPLEIDKLEGVYDVIIIGFFSEMFSVKTIKQLYDKFHCLIIGLLIDMYPMTGGCHFFGECSNYENECKKCPSQVLWRKRIVHNNYMLKKEVYAQSNYVLLCNTYVKGLADKSNLFPKGKIDTLPFTINEEFYYPIDQKKSRKMVGIAANKKFVMLARCSTAKRKGFVFITEAVKKLYHSINETEKDSLLLITIGEDSSVLLKDIDIDIMNLGRVDFDTLRNLYCSSDVFLSGSIDDAGPSMVNQAMACGTPVISFNIGTAVDVLIDGESGYKADILDEESFAICLRKFYSLSEIKRNEMRIRTRNIAIEYNSKATFAKKIEELYVSHR